VAEFFSENSYLSTNAWFSRNGPSGQFHNETIAKPLCIMQKIVQTIEISAKKANAQTAHSFFCQREMPTPKKIKELFLSTAQIRTNQ
jgi:hypothetical protein